jgi:hypothetical protein
MIRNLRTINNSFTPFTQKILTDVSLITCSHTSSIDRFHNIITNHYPNYIDTGKKTNNGKSLVNTGLMYSYANAFLQINNKNYKCDSLLGIYKMDPEEPIDKYPMISYRTSISSTYQKKTENISIKETKQKFESLKKIPYSYKKLYVSCLNECPYSGPVDLDLTLHEICHYYHKYNFDEISLCDTCASLTDEDFSYLLVSLVLFGVPKSKIALQLALNKHSIHNVLFAKKYGIHKWDVVADDYGGLRNILTYSMIEKWI